MAANAARNGAESLSARKDAARLFNSELFYRWFNRTRPARVTRRTIKDFGVGSEKNADAWPSTQARNIPPELLKPNANHYGIQPYARRRGNLSIREALDDATGIADLQSPYYRRVFKEVMGRSNPTFYTIRAASPVGTVAPRMKERPRMPFAAVVREAVHRHAFPQPRKPATRRKHKALTESVKRRIQAEAAAEQAFLEAAAAARAEAPSVASLERKYRGKK